MPTVKNYLIQTFLKSSLSIRCILKALQNQSKTKMVNPNQNCNHLNQTTLKISASKWKRKKNKKWSKMSSKIKKCNKMDSWKLPSLNSTFTITSHKSLSYKTVSNKFLKWNPNNWKKELKSSSSFILYLLNTNKKSPNSSLMKLKKGSLLQNHLLDWIRSFLNQLKFHHSKLPWISSWFLTIWIPSLLKSNQRTSKNQNLRLTF